MKVSEQLIAIRDALSPWAEQRSGVASVVSNLKDLWKQAELSSQKPRILICFTGQKIRGPFGRAAQSGRVDRTFNVAITRGRGFTTERGSTLTDPTGSIDPFYDHLEEVETLIRNIPYLTAEPPVDYKFNKAMQLGTMVIDGYLIEFSTANDLTTTDTAGD
jgi:hypothetical protein